LPKSSTTSDFKRNSRSFPLMEIFRMRGVRGFGGGDLAEGFRFSGSSGGADGAFPGDFCRRFVAMFFQYSSRFRLFPDSPKNSINADK
jgi:hypothetical protein